MLFFLNSSFSPHMIPSFGHLCSYSKIPLRYLGGIILFGLLAFPVFPWLFSLNVTPDLQERGDLVMDKRGKVKWFKDRWYIFKRCPI